LKRSEAGGRPSDGPSTRSIRQAERWESNRSSGGSASAEPLEASEKPFRLVKYFSSVAAVIIFVSCLVLAGALSGRAERIIIDRVVEDTVMIMDNLNFQMFANFLYPSYLEQGEARLSRPESYKLLHDVIRSTIHGFDIGGVALYDDKFGMMVYSSESDVPVVIYRLDPATGVPAPVGRFAEPMTSYREAIRLAYLSPPASDPSAEEGRPAAPEPQFRQDPGRAAYLDRLMASAVIVEERGGFLIGGFFPRGDFSIRCFKAMEDYYSGKISGVLELRRDLTGEYKQIARMQWMALAVAVGTGVFLSLVLRLVVARGESIINQKNEEKAALNERLSLAERLAGLGRMAATVSHEIRNPVGVIRATAEFLTGRLKDTPELARLTSAMVDECERLSRIVTDFLDFARPKEPSFEPVVVEDLLEEIFVLLEIDMARAGVELINRLRPDPGPIWADGPLLHRGLVNLLVNAIQAMSDGGLLTVATEVELPGEADGRLKVIIADTGPGLSEKALANLFKPFHTTKTKGTGLGLVLARNVVESHGGSLELRNVDGPEGIEGLEVVIWLPLRPAEVEAEAEEEATEDD
jgi:signal transduction histidine kinase